MGAGAKSDITQVRFADLWETYHCGLSKAVRKALAEDGNETETSGSVQYGTSRSESRVADGG